MQVEPTNQRASGTESELRLDYQRHLMHLRSDGQQQLRILKPVVRLLGLLQLVVRDIAEAGRRERPTGDLATDFVRPAGLPAFTVGTLFERAALALGVSSRPMSVREGTMRLHTKVRQWANKHW